MLEELAEPVVGVGVLVELEVWVVTMLVVALEVEPVMDVAEDDVVEVACVVDEVEVE